MAMDPRSKLDLSRLGYNLRGCYDDLMQAPPPDRLSRLVERFAAEAVRLPRIEDGPSV